MSKAYSESEDRTGQNGGGEGEQKKRAGAINQIHTERKCGNGYWEEKRVTPELDATFSLYCPHCSYLFYVPDISSL